jgi:kojibiose phosphorylase/nigerose phosphorylase
MISWKLKENGFDSDKIANFGNKFLVGNGYMGVRGTLDEYDKSNLVAINLAGIYDQVGNSWREPLNAPNAFYAFLNVDGKDLKLPVTEAKDHFVELDYRHGVLKRSTTWAVDKGDITLVSERFVSMKDVHLGAEKISITADFDAQISLTVGIDGDVWDINGPHYDELMFDVDDVLSVNAVTHEKKYNVSVALSTNADFVCDKNVVRDENKILETIKFDAVKGQTYEVERYFAIFTTKDCDASMKEAVALVQKAASEGFDAALYNQVNKWEDLWKLSEVEIEGDDKAMEALNYSLYHLHCIAPRHTDSLSIAARGLSGQTYKGAVFWDTEMFILDFFLMTEPDVAKKLMKYRIDTLAGAKAKAKGYGLEGAFYAWESQEGGFDACSDYNVTDVFTGRPMRTYFKDKQIHISAAVVYGIGRYVDLTGDISILSEGGAETIIECARFYYGLLLKKVSGDYYELHDVIGPDEYHERVNNNGYTNRMQSILLMKH